MADVDFDFDVGEFLGEDDQPQHKVSKKGPSSSSPTGQPPANLTPSSGQDNPVTTTGRKRTTAATVESPPTTAPTKPIIPSKENQAPSTSLSMAFPATCREAFFATLDSDMGDYVEKMGRMIQRRFPGPAGLLPKLQSNQIKILQTQPGHPLTQKFSKIISADLAREAEARAGKVSSSEIKYLNIMSNQDREVMKLDKGPWRELVRSLGLDYDDPKGLLKLMNIRWIRQTVVKEYSITAKIPFLAMVVLEEPATLAAKSSTTTMTKKNPAIKLMDGTGTIVAAVDSSFVAAYGAELTPGTALAVQNIRFLSNNKHYVALTITRKNVICLTSLVKDKPAVVDQKMTFSSNPSSLDLNVDDMTAPDIKETDSGVKIIKFKDFSVESIMKDYENMVRMKTNSRTSENRRPSTTHPSVFVPPRPTSGGATTKSTIGFGSSSPTPGPSSHSSLHNPSADSTVDNGEDDTCSMFADDDEDDHMLAMAVDLADQADFSLMDD